MKDLICRVFGHDWMLMHEVRVCDCNPDCKGHYREYVGSRCLRCDLWRHAA